MRRSLVRGWGLVIGLMLAGGQAAQAQQDVTGDAVMTRAGLARIVDAGDGSRLLMVGDVPVPLPDAPYMAFIEKKLGDLLLVLYSQGGNGCPGFYVWVHATPGAVRRTEGFGTCSDLAQVTHDSETVSVTMPSFEPGKGDVTFVYDGRGPVREVQLGLAPSGMKPGDGPDFWIGRYPYDLLAARDFQDRLAALLGPAGLADAQRMMALASPMQRDGNWVAGDGCQPHDCADNRGALAVHLLDGRIVLALRDRTGLRLWGDDGRMLPAVFADILRDR